jgi:hypothetical protein
MRKLLIILLLSGTAYGQSTTVAQKPGQLTLIGTNFNGNRIGFFRFDSLSGQFTRTGNQVALFRGLMRFQNIERRRLELAENVLRWIDSTGKIQYPIEFMEDLKKWSRQ